MTDADYDPAIYSHTSTTIRNDDGTSTFRRMTWAELYEETHAKLATAQKFVAMVHDLDRNEHGRHEGDADSSDPTGISQGNPFPLTTGSTIGYDISGNPYVMPPRGQRHNPDAWSAR